MELSNNYSSIFTGLSNYFTLTQRSYAGLRNFYLKNFDYPEKPLKYKHIRRISD